jgi:starch-binding outer membrane protein, SusD/RagB family
MKKIKYILIISVFFGIISCESFLESDNLNNPQVKDYYKTLNDLNTALNGCYSSMRSGLNDEFALTEIRSDNAFLSVGNTTNQVNLNVRDFDNFDPATNNQSIYNYWLSSYKSIRNTNLLLGALKVNYTQGDTDLVYDSSFNITGVTDVDRKQISAQASFIRAYNYFNLVRLFGDVYLIERIYSDSEVFKINRKPTADIYKLIVADLKNAVANGISTKYAASNSGNATTWAAKALLAKVYLTINDKASATPLLQDVITNSLYGLVTTGTPNAYASVFSENNELNKEILFAIRFKSGGIGQGSPITNLAAPNIATVTVGNIVGSALGNYGFTREYFSTFATTDLRRDSNAKPFTTSATEKRYYANKWITKIPNANDSDLDWPVLRFADVLLMYAEAAGNNATSIGYINQVRLRAGVPALSTTLTNDVFEKALADERRWEFGGENQRMFDLIRFQSTLTGFNAEAVLDAHFSTMTLAPISVYPSATASNFYNPLTGVPTVNQLQINCSANRLLLPIPQQEIDTNTFITIPQNPGY